MVNEDFRHLMPPQEQLKRKLLTIAGWTAYVIFGLFSSFILLLTVGFWPIFAWIVALIFGPRLFWKIR